MSTPATQGHLAEADGGHDGWAASSSDVAVATPGVGARNAGAGGRDWLNFAMFSIGGVAVAGFLVIMFGIYVMEPDSVVMVLAGMAILLVATIAWLVTAWVLLGGFVLGLFTARGKKSRKS